MPDLLTVDLWLASEPALLAAPLAANYASLLSANEHERWQRFARDADKQRFLLARALTRTVLARYLDAQPQALQFVQNQYGKPMLADAQKQPLHFNLSHTRGMVVLAVSRQAELGVDVEAVSRKVELMDLARRYFSLSEVQQLESMRTQQQQEYFFALWTLKEAWVKAKGLGLRLPLNAFSFSLLEAGMKSDQISLHCDKSLQEVPENWSFQRIALKDFRVALALNNPAGSSLLVKVLQTDTDFKPRISNC